MKQPKVAFRANTSQLWAIHIPNKSAESPSKCRELTWDLFAGTSMEAAGGDAVAEVPEAELNRGRRKGKRPTRAEKGSYMGNQDFVREVKDGLQHSMSPPPSLGSVLALHFLLELWQRGWICSRSQEGKLTFSVTLLPHP